MSQNRKKPKKQTPPAPRRMPRLLIPLEPKNFSEGFRAAAENMSNTEPTPDFLLPTLDLADDGNIQRIKFKDSSLLRLVETLRLHYNDDRATHYSAMMRVWALYGIIETGLVDPWTERDGDQAQIHDAVLSAAATAQLYDTKDFEPEMFLAEVRRHEATG